MKYKQKNETNAVFYMDKYDNVFNLTTVRKLPIFISLPFLKGSDEAL